MKAYILWMSRWPYSVLNLGVIPIKLSSSFVN